MTPSPPNNVIIPVRVAPMAGLVGAVEVDGFWSQTQAQPTRWRGGPKPVTEWTRGARPDRVLWRKEK